MDLATSLVSEYIVAPIGRQVRYLTFPRRYFHQLEDQLNQLKEKREMIQHRVDDEIRNGCEIEAAVLVWMEKADETLDKAKDLIENSYRVKAGCSGLSSSNIIIRRRLSKRAREMSQYYAHIRDEGMLDKISYRLPLRVAVDSTFASRRGGIKFESREAIKNDILEAIRDPEVSLIGVYGLGGVGKTTLVREVAGYAKEEKLLDAVILTTVSHTPDIRRIQGEIADLLGVKLNQQSTGGRAVHLKYRLKGERNILVILDDVRKRLDLEDLGIPFGEHHKGCKMLLTSRNPSVLQIMGTQRNFRLEVLEEEETWNLFEAVAGDVVQDPIVRNIAIKVAKRSAGLPAIAVTVAEELRNKDIYSWKDALSQLNKCNNKEMNEIIYSALDLRWNGAKEIFLLCGVLEKNIVINNLLKYVIGLGLVEDLNHVEEARDILYIIIRALNASCLLLEDDTSARVRMHDIIREVAASIASRDHHVFTIKQDAKLKEWPSEDLLRRCPQIILHCDHIQQLPERLDCPELKLLYLNSGNNRTLKIPDSFFEGMGKLKVLHLTSMNMPSLPTSLCILTELKTLCLDYCALGDLVGIGELKNLSILSIVHSSMEKFPQEIVQLTNLKMLDLSNSGIEVMPSMVLSKLIRLEELYMGNTSVKWEVGNSANTSLAKLMRLPKLTTLEVQIQDAWILPAEIIENLERFKIVIGDVWEWCDKYGMSKMLKLKLGTSIHLEHGIKALLERVGDLYLDEIDGISNVLYQLSENGFPILKHLLVQNNAEIRHIVNSMERNQTHVAFPALETLVLDNLNSLEKICHGPFTVNSFGKLRVIKIKRCDRLKYLILYSTFEDLPQLHEIEVFECTSMEMIVLVDDGKTIDEIKFSPLRVLTLQHLPRIHFFCSNKWTNIPCFFSTKVAFPNLETLKLSSINLNTFWEDDHTLAYSFNNLANLIVEDCGGPTYLFSSFNIYRSLSNLKRLEISKCHTMEEIITTTERDFAGFASEKVILPKLETIIVKDMQNLKTIWNPTLDPGSFGRSLKMLEVINCDKLENIFPSYMVSSIVSLDTLVVSDCDSVKEIFELNVNEMHNSEGNTTQLRRVTLLRLPNLRQIWSEDPQGIFHFHNLQDVRVEDCGNMEFLFPFSIAMNLLQLEKLQVKSCGMKEFVAKKEGHEERLAVFPFNKLTSLVLWNLHELERLYAGNHAVACSSLKELFVLNCHKLNLYKTQNVSSEGVISGGELHLSMQQSLFRVEKVIPYLEQLTLSSKDVDIILQGQFSGDIFNKIKLLRLNCFGDEHAPFLDWLLQNVPRLEWLIVQNSSFKQIFQDENVAENERLEIRTRLKKLTLLSLAELQHLCTEGSEIDPMLELLEYLHLAHCSSLINLAPSHVSFSHLVYLAVENCNKLINLITTSTARSLFKLTTMKIKGSDSLEEMVVEVEPKTQNEIVFGSLKTLEMECLPRLASFCSAECLLKFPLLDKVVVRQCPKMEIFSTSETSTPMLRKVLVGEKDEEWCWNGDLNATITKMSVKSGVISESRSSTLELVKFFSGL